MGAPSNTALSSRECFWETKTTSGTGLIGVASRFLSPTMIVCYDNEGDVEKDFSFFSAIVDFFSFSFQPLLAPSSSYC